MVFPLDKGLAAPGAYATSFGGVAVRGHRPETGSKVIVHVLLAKGGQDSARRTNENVLGLLLALGQGSVALKVWAAAHRRQHHAVP